MFTINNIQWRVSYVHPLSAYLTRSDGTQTVGMCSSCDYTIYLSDMLEGAFLEKVLCHEMTHAFCMSYGLSIPIEREEWLCDFMSTYGKDIIYLLDNVLQGLEERIS